MATWIIQDGAPELGRGSFLRRTGLRANCASVDPARVPADGITELADGGRVRPGGHAYELTGLAGAAHDVFAGNGPPGRPVASEFLITAGDLRYIASAAAPAAGIAAGSRITAPCTLSVVADYEWDAFGLPDLCSDWQVLRLKVEHTQLHDPHGGPADPLACPPGAVLRSIEIDQMSRWDDDRDPAITAWYVLDLLPVPGS